MKNSQTVQLLLRVAALLFSLASLLCIILANLDEIQAGLGCLRQKLQEKKGLFCCGCCCDSDDEYEDWGA